MTAEHHKARQMREREIRALQACTCRYPILAYRYRNVHGHEPACPAGALALGFGAFDNATTEPEKVTKR